MEIPTRVWEDTTVRALAPKGEYQDGASKTEGFSFYIISASTLSDFNPTFFHMYNQMRFS